jgi:NAD-dependent dihydropyrimidine dehydrogenase PreA subunit
MAFSLNQGESDMDNYERFRQMLNAHPSGAPKSTAFKKILKLLFTPEEIEVALGMGFAPKDIHVIAEAAGVSEEEASARCESMADKGVIYSRMKRGEMGYALLPTVPGLFEFPFMTGGGTPTHDQLARLWQEYHHEALGEEFAGSETPFTRVIPVRESISPDIEVLPYEEIPEMLEDAKTIALAQCPCRVSVGACDNPLDVCLIFDSTAEFLISRKIARKITQEEALQAVRRAEEAGLVHTVNNSQDKLTLICGCCSCCCTILRGFTQLHSANAIAKSRWLAQVDPDLCTGCETCIDERCQVGAISMADGVAVVQADNCIGCGLCASECPDGAVTMILRPQEIAEPPATVVEMGLKIANEKGRLEKFMELMKR